MALDRRAALLAGLGSELVELRVENDPAGALAAMRAAGIAADDAFAVGSTLTVPLTRQEAKPQIAAAFSPIERAGFRMLGIRQVMRLNVVPAKS